MLYLRMDNGKSSQFHPKITKDTCDFGPLDHNRHIRHGLRFTLQGRKDHGGIGLPAGIHLYRCKEMGQDGSRWVIPKLTLKQKTPRC